MQSYSLRCNRTHAKSADAIMPISDEFGELNATIVGGLIIL